MLVCGNKNKSPVCGPFVLEGYLRELSPAPLKDRMTAARHTAHHHMTQEGKVTQEAT